MSNVRRAQRIQSAASTNLTSVKAGFTVVMCVQIGNNGAGAAYFKVYDKATAPVLAADTPVATFLIPAGQSVDVELGITMSAGFAFAITGGPADTNTTAVLADQVTGIIFYD